MRVVWHFLKIVVALGVSLYVFACALLFFTQRSLIYYPQPASNRSVKQEKLMVKGDAIALSTYPQPGSGAVIYFGGNAEDVSQDIPDLEHAFPRRAIYALQYPGYGASSGSPTQKTVFDAAIAATDHAFTKHSDVIVVGRSLGSGVAVWVASQRRASGLVLITPFDSLADAAQKQYPFLPIGLLLRDRYDSWKYAPQVMCSTHLVIAANDELVPRSSSEKLLTRFGKGVASTTVLKGVGHNTIQDDPNYWAVVNSGFPIPQS